MPGFAPVVLVAIVITLWVRRFVRQRDLQKYAEQQKALNPPQFKYPEQIPFGIKLPWGISYILSVFRDINEGRLLKTIHARYERLGDTFDIPNILGSRQVNTRDPENIKALLSKQFTQFDIRREATFGPFMGSGIFNQAQGHGWEESRALLRPQFNKAQISNDLEHTDFHVQRMLGLIPPNKVFDIQPLMFRLTLDTSTDFLFGESVESLLLNDEPAIGSFAEAFDTGTDLISKKEKANRLRVLVGIKDWPRVIKTARDYVGTIVDKALSPENQERIAKKEKGGKYVFLDALIAETNNRKVLIDQLLNILLAGRDTTAGFLSMTLWLLARNRRVFVKLREEVMQTFPDGEMPDWASMKNMKYLKWVLNESLRVLPLVPVNGRVPRARTTLPRGGGPDGTHPVVVDTDTKVFYSVYSMHRNKSIYGPDADSFIPERWEHLKVGWEFLPFNGGPRICLGQQFALVEASFVMVRLLQRFKDLIGWDPKTEREIDGWSGDATVNDFPEGLTLTLRSQEGVWIRLVPADQ